MWCDISYRLLEVGVWLGVIVPGEILSGTVNQVSICITLVSCLFQYVMVFHRSCVYFGEQKVEPIEYCSCTKLTIHRRAIWLFVLLASSALSLAVLCFSNLFAEHSGALESGSWPQKFCRVRQTLEYHTRSRQRLFKQHHGKDGQEQWSSC